jgi:hypothetical protein
MGGGSVAYLSGANMQGLTVLVWQLGRVVVAFRHEHRVFTLSMSSHPPFCSRSIATASASTAASTEFAAAGAISRLTAAVLDLNDNEEVDDVDDEGEDDDNNEDNSVVLVCKKPAARPSPGKKAPFPCVLGDVLRIMQDRLNANASRTNADLLLY